MSETKAYDADSQMEEVFHHFVSEKKLINEENPSIDIFNIDFFKARLESLKKAFPEDFFLHAMALKGKFYHYFAKNKIKEFQWVCDGGWLVQLNT